MRWTREKARGALVEAAQSGDWNTLHRTAARYGLAFKKRGAGLVLANRGSKEHVKASSIDRGLSFRALTAKAGPFIEAPKRLPTAAERYEPVPEQHTDKDTNTLYADYKQARDRAFSARRASRESLTKQRSTYKRELSAWYQERGALLKRRKDLTRHERRQAWQALSRERGEDWAKHRADWARDRAAVRDNHPLPTWQSYLQQAADDGNTKALDALRRRERKGEKLIANMLSAPNPEAAKSIIYAYARPRTMKDGSVIYNAMDGGRVVDTKGNVRVDQASDGAMALALTLAAARYEGQALTLEGDDAFKAAAIRVAVKYGMAVRFDDKKIEAAHKQAAEKVVKTPDATVQAYADKRNVDRARLSDISYHRPWLPTDTNEVKYAGRRKIGDGKEAVLLKDGETMLVKQVSPAQAAKASRWRRGDTVALDARGRFVKAPTPTQKRGTSR